MALADMRWKMSGWQSLATTDIDAVLDAIYDWFNTASSYYTGSRSGGWTAEREQVTGTTVAVRLVPPALVGSIGQRIVLAGTTGASTPTMSSSNTFLQDGLHVATVKNVTNESAYQDFENADIYTGGNSTGFARCLPSVATTTITGFMVYEGREGIALLFRSNATNAPCYGFIAGALWDTFDPSEAESDGRVYGQISSGSNVINTFFTASSGGAFLHNGSGAGTMSAVSFEPGEATTIGLMWNYQAYTTAASTLVGSGSAGVIERIPVVHRAASTNAYLGRLRNCYVVGPGFAGHVVRSPQGDDLAYRLGATSTTAATTTIALSVGE